MHKVFAIAAITIRSAIRSKVVLCLVLLLLAVIIGLPLSVKGDGTIEGYLQVLLTYTLGLATFILALTTLWAGCASIALEINDKTLHLITTKPVSGWQLWLGKWLGLNMINAALLAASGLLIVLLIHQQLKPLQEADPQQRAEAARLLSARAVLAPHQPDFTAAARGKLAEHLKGGPLPDGMTPDDALMDLAQQMRFEASQVAPGQRIRWIFGPLPTRDSNRAMSLQYRFSTSDIGQGLARGEWRIGIRDDPDLLRIPVTGAPRTRNETAFQLDASVVASELVVVYLNQSESGATLVFDGTEGVALLIPRGGFAANYLRGLLILWGQLSLLAAIGITAGALFSMPVAAFLSLFFLLLLHMGGYIQSVAATGLFFEEHVHMHGAVTQEEPPGLFRQAMDTSLYLFYKLLALIMRPLLPEPVLQALAGGQIITPTQVFRGFVLQGLVLALLTGRITGWILQRREIGLPGESI